MSRVASQPPPPKSPLPLIALADDDRRRRLELHLMQLGLAAVTVLLTAWCCTLGWIPAILALVIAKHILVAILVMGLGVDAPQRARFF
jgi:hypothetical protein